MDTPYTHPIGNGDVLNVYNLAGYARNDPRFIAGRTKYDAVGRWNNRGIFKIGLMELDQIYVDSGGLYTIGTYIKHWTFDGYIPNPEVFKS
jgi:hypothetical protein